jgi:NAD(P)-dependent dehydrogenase (short-subunit alcohol dehydrogenase family)
VELGPIRVNAVSPGLTRTPRWNAWTDAFRQAFYDREESRLPVRRVGKAPEIASAYIYFMKNTYATGKRPERRRRRFARLKQAKLAADNRLHLPALLLRS